MFSWLPVRPSSQWISTICFTSLLTFLPLTEPYKKPFRVSASICVWSEDYWLLSFPFPMNRGTIVSHYQTSRQLTIVDILSSSSQFCRKETWKIPFSVGRLQVVARGEDMLRSGYQLSGKETFFDSLLCCTQFWMQKVGQQCIVSAILGFLDIPFYS